MNFSLSIYYQSMEQI